MTGTVPSNVGAVVSLNERGRPNRAFATPSKRENSSKIMCRFNMRFCKFNYSMWPDSSALIVTCG